MLISDRETVADAVADFAATAGVSEQVAVRNLLGLLCERILAEHIRPNAELVTASVSLRVSYGLVTVTGPPPASPAAAMPRPALFELAP